MTSDFACAPTTNQGLNIVLFTVKKSFKKSLKKGHNHIKQYTSKESKG